MNNIWKKVSKDGTFFCLAPMADVTDIAFRQIIAKYSNHNKKGGGPAVFFTEFVSADGIASDIGRKKLLPLLKFAKKEKPIIAQIFSSKPENIKTTCQIISKLGFDGIDINMGCPDKKVVKQGAGSALINTPQLAQEIIRAARVGAPKLPISVKTRIGFNQIEYEKWLPKIVTEDISALTIHLRTKKEMSNVPAHFELAKDIVNTVRKYNKDIVLIENGDIQNLEHGKKNAIEAGFDGIMVGRGIFGNPWFFNSKININNVPINKRLLVLIEHTKLYGKLLKHRNFENMKKHFKAYVSGFEGAKELRVELMKVHDVKGVEKLIKNYIKSRGGK